MARSTNCANALMPLQPRERTAVKADVRGSACHLPITDADVFGEDELAVPEIAADSGSYLDMTNGAVAKTYERIVILALLCGQLLAIELNGAALGPRFPCRRRAGIEDDC